MNVRSPQHRLLPNAFYERADVVQIAKDLLGKGLFTQDADGNITGGTITETEAYGGPLDKACHAYQHRKSTRTQVMYLPGGVAYVYLCYGIHSLLNVVTHQQGEPYAVLIRALEPTYGVEFMLSRRALQAAVPRLTAGPGLLTQALGITRQHNGMSLGSELIWIEDLGTKITEQDYLASPRVGVGYAGEDALLPWRFRIKGSNWTSPAK